MANVERRRHERVKVDRAVTIRDGSEMHDGVLMDISSSGAAVSLDDDDYEFESDQDLAACRTYRLATWLARG